MEQTKKHLGRRIFFGVLTALIVAALVAAPFILERRNKQTDAASILSDTVSRGSITKTLSGTGTLTEEEALEVTVPLGVEITSYYVANGDMVTEGQPVAVVDKTSVMRTISNVNEKLDDLAKEIREADGKKADQYVTARSAGRIKAVYAAVGDDVRDVITQYGALAVISLDGKMAVDLDAAGLSVGQNVTVTLSDGAAVAGLVRTLADGVGVVVIDDKYGSIDEAVTVTDADGSLLGEGTLYVHSPWKAIAYTGTVAGTYLGQGKKASVGAYLFRLTGTEYTAEYELLLEKRREYEDILYQLFLLYQDGTVKAPCDGCVSGVDKDLLKELGASEGGYTLMLLAAHTPNERDDVSYQNMVGVVTQVNKDGTAVAKLRLGNVAIDDYADLSGVSTAVDLNSAAEVTFTPGVIYQNDGTSTEPIWNQRYEVNRGDIFLFAFDSNLAWMIYVGHTDNLPEPTTPTGPGGGDTPGGGNRPGGFSGGGIGGMGQQQQTQEEEEDAAETVTILSVTPQNKVTVTITVDELDILSVKMGQEVNVTVDALPGQSFGGDITSIDTTATNDGGNTKYAVEITMDRTPKMLGGMNASARITLLKRDDILTIPTQALSEGETETVVYTGYDAEKETLLDPVTVKTGLSDGLRTEILSGLSQGDAIWYSYYEEQADTAEPPSFPG